MRIECKLNYRFCVRITTYKCQDKKSNARIINCKLCSIDVTVWGFALIFDFLIISFCLICTGIIKIFTQVRWSLKSECEYKNFKGLCYYLTVNRLIKDSATLRCILIVRRNMDHSCLIYYNIYTNCTFIYFIFLIWYVLWWMIPSKWIILNVIWMSKTWSKQLWQIQCLSIEPVLLDLTSR